MTILKFLDKEVVVLRLKDVVGSRRNYTTTATVDIHVQEMDKEAIRELDMVEDRAWIGYFSIDDAEKIKEQDQLILSGKKYKVISKTEKDYEFSGNQHVEVIFIEYTKE